MIRVVLAMALAGAVTLGFPDAGAAQSAPVQARGTAGAPKPIPQRQAKLRAPRAAEKPCAARTWAGCQGWDPDPHVRSMIQMDAGRDDR